jgi:coenzyme F420-reducing hydrogenase delta subunit
MSQPPSIIAFVCNWEGYRGLDAAAQQGLNIPSQVKIVRVSCLSRVHSGLILKAFELGAGGVILVGCSDHHCHYGTEQSLVDNTLIKVRGIMGLLGLRPAQLELCRPGLADGPALVQTLSDFSRKISESWCSKT